MYGVMVFGRRCIGWYVCGCCVVLYVCLSYKKYLKFIPMLGRCVAEKRHRSPL